MAINMNDEYLCIGKGGRLMFMCVDRKQPVGTSRGLEVTKYIYSNEVKYNYEVLYSSIYRILKL